jgi:hypothetical protein
LRGPWISIVLGAVVIFFALLQLYHVSLLHRGLSYQKFGDVATWFAGMMTLGAVAVALRESYRSGIRYRQEDDRRLTSVIPWLDIGDSAWQLRVDNRTGQVVEAWCMDFPETGVHLCWRDAGPCPPGLITLSLENVRNLPPMVSSNFPAHTFTFIDGRDRVWSRDSSGGLQAAGMTAADLRAHRCGTAQ